MIVQMLLELYFLLNKYDEGPLETTPFNTK